MNRMASKEKALSIVEKCAIWHWNAGVCAYEKAKQCALICAEEVIDQWEYIDTYISDLGGKLNPNLKYWLEVKEELLKL